MLTFLRKIRRSLIESGSAQKYIVYAIGEIALVVIGILIALQINNWNEHRKDGILIKSYLVKIHDELEANKSILEQEKADWEERIISASILLKSLQNKRIMSGDTLAFNQGLRRTGRFFAPVLDFKIYDEMIANGILGKMGDGEIKGSIQNVYSRMKSFETRFSERKDKPMNLKDRVNCHESVRFGMDAQSLAEPTGDWDYSISVDYDGLFNDHLVINDLTSVLDYMRDLIATCEFQIRRCTRTQERIDTEIDKK